MSGVCLRTGQAHSHASADLSKGHNVEAKELIAGELRIRGYHRKHALSAQIDVDESHD
jgi:hypothetical protein